MFGFLKTCQSNISSMFSRTRDFLGKKFFAVFSSRSKDQDIEEKVLEILLDSDFSFSTSKKIASFMKRFGELGDEDSSDYSYDIFKEKILEVLRSIVSKVDHKALDFSGSSTKVILLIGVNGAGKTSVAGKIAYLAKSRGRSVLLVPADTFRYAAKEQLAIWATRAGVELFEENLKNPASAIYSGIKYGLDNNKNVIIIDIAGRLDSNQPLMDELRKLVKISEKFPEVELDRLLVVDVGAGAVCVENCKTFVDHVSIDGIISTKIDGSTKGGAIVSLIDECKIGIRMMSTGEKIEDITFFNEEMFINTLL
ncbi:MAG: hypothetical protein KAH32_02275 [Chlamydiia bacterium]|nr:hypothetical protein [Chlamydiia bacterium]